MGTSPLILCNIPEPRPTLLGLIACSAVFSAGANNRVEQNRRRALRCSERPGNLKGGGACVSPSPAAVAHPCR